MTSLYAITTKKTMILLFSIITLTNTITQTSVDEATQKQLLSFAFDMTQNYAETLQSCVQKERDLGSNPEEANSGLSKCMDTFHGYQRNIKSRKETIADLTTQINQDCSAQMIELQQKNKTIIPNTKDPLAQKCFTSCTMLLAAYKNAIDLLQTPEKKA